MIRSTSIRALTSNHRHVHLQIYTILFVWAEESDYRVRSARAARISLRFRVEQTRINPTADGEKRTRVEFFVVAGRLVTDTAAKRKESGQREGGGRRPGRLPRTPGIQISCACRKGGQVANRAAGEGETERQTPRDLHYLRLQKSPLCRKWGSLRSFFSALSLVCTLDPLHSSAFAFPRVREERQAGRQASRAEGADMQRGCRETVARGGGEDVYPFLPSFT